MEKAKLGCERLVALFDEKIAEIDLEEEAAIEKVKEEYAERKKFYKQDREHYIDIIPDELVADEAVVEPVEEPEAVIDNIIPTAENVAEPVAVEEETNLYGG